MNCRSLFILSVGVWQSISEDRVTENRERQLETEENYDIR